MPLHQHGHHQHPFHYHVPFLMEIMVDTIMIMILLAQGGDSSLCIRARLCPGSPDSLPHCGQVTILMMEMRLSGIPMNHCRQVPEQVCHPKPVTECHPVARKVPRKVCIMTRWRWRWQESFWGISSFDFLRCAPQLLFLHIPTVLTIQSLSTENREVFTMKLWVAALFISSPLCLA